MHELSAAELHQTYVERIQPPPRIHQVNEPFWQAAAEERLVLQRCGQCSQLRYPISPLCPFCTSEQYSWDQVSGRGTIWAHAVAHRQTLPAFDLEAPYAVVVVELEDGPRIASNLVNWTQEHLRVGQPVEACFTKTEDGTTLPRFQPAK